MANENKTPNYTLTFHRTHPSNRVSYTIPGVPGNVVFFNTMFADGIAPPTITVDVELAQPRVIPGKAEKEAAAAAKALERAAKAEERQRIAAEKLAARQAKADAALAAARAKIEAATKSA